MGCRVQVLSMLVLMNLGYSSSPAENTADKKLVKAKPRANSGRVDVWNQFRGPNGSGVTVASQPPVKIDSAKPTWKTATPFGHSSPVLSNDRIFLTGIEEGRLVTLAYEKATGKLAWRRKAPEVVLEKAHKASSQAAPTPVVDKDHIYVYFGSYGMLCYDHDGKELWKKPIPTPRTLYGTSASPISYGDLIIIVLDDDNNLPRSRLSRSRLLALKKATGEKAWETPRPFQRSGWSTPMIWSHSDQTELVVLGNGRLCGYDLPSGQEKWFVTGFSRETISSPVAGNGFVFASASRRGGGGGDSPRAQDEWWCSQERPRPRERRRREDRLRQPSGTRGERQKVRGASRGGSEPLRNRYGGRDHRDPRRLRGYGRPGRGRRPLGGWWPRMPRPRGRGVGRARVR